jgi:hypothetical protein
MTDQPRTQKGITRLDDPKKGSYGWLVRVTFEKKVHSKFFGDTKCGGSDQALAAAVKHRDALEKELGKPRTDRRIKTRSVNTQTGVVGVQLVSRQLKNRVNAYYEVCVSPEPNLLHKKRFPVTDGNFDAAFQAAVAYRQEMERRVYGRVIQEMPAEG